MRLILNSVFILLITIFTSVAVHAQNIIKIIGVIDEKTYNTVEAGMKAYQYQDTIYIYINSPGGQTLFMEKIIRKLNHTRQRVICYASGQAASAAAVILINCPEFSLDPGTIVLFHAPSLIDNNGKKVKALPTTYPTVWNRYYIFFAPAVAYILTPEEVKRVKQGEDVYMTGQELINRLK